MAKRFHDTEIWEQDWFSDLPNKYKIFWFYLKDKCDNVGIWRPNKSMAQKIINEPINLDEFLTFVNVGKERIKVLPTGRWFIKDYFVFQYGDKFSPNSPVHKGALKALLQNGVHPKEILGNSVKKIQNIDIEELKEIAYSKDNSRLLLAFDYPTNKVKDKDKDKDKDINSEGECSDRLNSNLSHSGLNFSLEKSAEKNLSFPLSETQPKVEFENSEDYVSKLFDSGTIQLAPKEFPTWRQECKEFLLDKYQQAALRKETGLRDAELMQHKRDFLVRLNIECDFKNAAALKKHFANYLRKHFGASFLPGKSSAFIQPEFTDYSQMEIRE